MSAPRFRREPFATPPDVRIPPWLAAAVALAVVAGAALGAAGVGVAPQPVPGQRVAGGVFMAGAFGYLGASLVDLWEHLRLEKRATGRYLAWVAVPVGESANHAATIAAIVALLVLARPLAAPLAPRDWYVLAAPAVILALGWRDEVVYHRKRAEHREDIMHTVAHLGLGTMLSGLYASRVVPWDRV